MISCIQEAAALEEIDLSSETVSKFFLASDTYDSLTEEEQAEIDAGVKEALETVRNRIAGTDFF